MDAKIKHGAAYFFFGGGTPIEHAVALTESNPTLFSSGHIHPFGRKPSV